MEVNGIFEWVKGLVFLERLPELGSGSGWGVLLVFGLLTSFHCVGMCGGIVMSQCIKKDHSSSANSGGKASSVIPSSLYNLGRIVSYTIVGGAAGLLGNIISLPGVWKGAVPVAGGMLMIIMAINLLGISRVLRRLSIRMPYFAVKKIKSGNSLGPLAVGLLSGIMPCGPLQIVQLYSLSTGSAVLGAASSFVFVIGTVPALFVFGTVSTAITKKYSNMILKASAVLVFVMGIAMVGRGMALMGVSPVLANVASVNSVQALPAEDRIVQTVTTEIKSGSYPEIKVKKGIPVEWTIIADPEKLNKCNEAIVIPEFKIEKRLYEGENLVEFTPDKAGEFIYTCWMGMIKSKIIVEEDPGGMEPVKETEQLEKSTKYSRHTDIKKRATEDTGKDKKPVGEAAGKPVSRTDTKRIEDKDTEEQSILIGVLIDEHCFGLIDPEKETKVCLQMDECESGGYGIAVKQQNGEYRFYRLDRHGHDLAAQLLEISSEDGTLRLRVKGSIEGSIIKAQSVEGVG